MKNSILTLAARADEQKMQTMTSLQVAEITGRIHSNVMRDIRNLLEQLEDKAQFSFELGSYQDANSQNRPCYILTKKDCLLLASGYDANLRAKIINRWEELELAGKPKIPQTFSQALLLAAQQQEQIEQQQAMLLEQSKAISEMKPKVSYCDIILQSPSTVLVTQIAQDYGKSAKAFNKLLHELGIQRKVGRQWVLYSQYIANGYVQSATERMKNSSAGRKYTYSKWTQNGRIFLYNELKNSGVLPLKEQAA